MKDISMERASADEPAVDGTLDNLIGRLRRVQQRASAIFAEQIGDGQVTPTQWAALVTLREKGALSQNQLGRHTNMDPATTQGVVLRLADRKLVERRPDPADRRRTNVSLTPSGQAMVSALEGNAAVINARIVEKLAPSEQRMLSLLLDKLS